MKKFFLQSYKTKAGFTLIETMIAVSLFIVIVVAGMGALLNASLLHQKSQDMRSIMDNLSFIMDDMSRNLRTGYDYRCLTGNDNLSNVSTPLSCSSGWGIAFESASGSTSNNNDQWVYYISGAGKIFKSTAGPYIASNFIQLSPDQVQIDPVASGFSVIGAEPPSSGDKQEPLVTIRLVGKITYQNVVTPFSIQTSVSQRLLDL